MLVVPRAHPLAGQTAIDKDELYNLTFVTLNQGSTVQAAQEQALHQHGITWRTLNIDMVRGCTLHTSAHEGQHICMCLQIHVTHSMHSDAAVLPARPARKQLDPLSTCV